MGHVETQAAHNIVPDLGGLAVRVSELALDPKPHRIHSREEIQDLKASLTRYGQDQPLIVQKDGMIVRVGNGRLKAARELGWTHVAAIVLDREEAEMIARGVIDNRVADKARTDTEVIAELLGELRSIDETLPTGFSDQEVMQLLDGNLEPPAEAPLPEDEVIEFEGIEAGASWRLGRHVLLCGDSTSEESVAKLLEVARIRSVDQLLTDPPYGVDYGSIGRGAESLNPSYRKFLSKFPRRKEIENDQGHDYREFFSRFLGLCPMSDKNTAYVFMAGQELHNLRLALDEAGFTLGDYLVWVKQNFVMSRKDYNAGHEFVVYAWKGSHKFYGPVGKASTVLSFDRPMSSKAHPTMKPIDLLTRLIQDGSAPDAVVYDPFLGSGSTLIACEMSGRRCIGIELEPRYCVTTVRRWERYTGQTAERLE